MRPEPPPSPATSTLDPADVRTRVATLLGREEPASAPESLVGEDLSGLDLSGIDLSGLDLSRAKLAGATLVGAKLRGTILFEADLEDAEFAGADLSNANLGSANLQRAGLGAANLTGASLQRADLSHASLVDADLSGAQLRIAVLENARLRGARLVGTDLGHARLAHADLEGCDVTDAVFDDADLRGARLSRISGYRKARWIGTDLREMDFTGAYLCRAFILDQNFLEEFRAQSRVHEFLYRVWWLTSDCGRSVLRWAACTNALVLVFAWAYTFVDIDYGAYETPLSPLYFSVVTITTLGYGDVVPASMAGQTVAMLQVVTGYLMLGGLLSIFSRKMASRAD